ncbi:MAG: ROK family protein [Candidatus Margulisiibacteriota bacterium]|jgi:glucokinase
MDQKYYIGIDVGGTKILAAVVDKAGRIKAREKQPTPKNANSKEILRTIMTTIVTVQKKAGLSLKDIAGIGLAVPGIVDPVKGKILITPNTGLSGLDISKELKKKFGKIKIAVGNDVNLGILGECWLGVAKGARNVVGIFPGTGVGGGVVIDGRLLLGKHGAAAEVGHMIVQVNGPRCSCGNKGCLEALSGRWAIEKALRLSLKQGRKTIVTKLLGGKLKTIKSKTLAKALQKKDKLVTELLTSAACALGSACISLRHIFDPEMIVFGGGLIEACGDFYLPIIQKTVAKDPFFGKLGPVKIVRSKLGDDAVVLGAVALALVKG